MCVCLCITQWYWIILAAMQVCIIHNGIEYSDMQLISESYYLLKKILGVNNNEIAEIFCDWNEGELSSYLISITGKILIKKD